MKKIILLFLFILLLFPTTVTASPHSEGIKNIAVILINWQNNQSEPWTKEYIENEVFISPSSISAYYDDTSYGKLTLQGDVLGWYTVPYNKSPCGMRGSWVFSADAQATAQNISLSEYDFLIYVWPFTDCGWSGISQVNGSISYINGFSTETIAHEFGHSLGVSHANTQTCTVNEVFVQVSTTCQNWEYQDRYDVMGNSSFFTMNAIHRSTLGWLPTSQTQVVNNSGTFKISPLNWRTSEIQQIQVAVPKKKGVAQPSYCLEVRQSYGWDNFNETSPNGVHWGVDGIMIRRNNCLFSTHTWLMDATPNSPDIPSGANAFDQTLSVGQTFTDPNAKISIKTLSIDNNGATVQITYLKGN